MFSKGGLQVKKNCSGRFPEGVHKEEIQQSTMTTSTVAARKKRRPSTLCWGKKKKRVGIRVIITTFLRKWYLWTFETLKTEVLFILPAWYFESLKCSIVSANQGLTCCFSNRGDKVSMGHFKAIDIRWINKKEKMFRIGSDNSRKQCCPYINKNGKK